MRMPPCVELTTLNDSKHDSYYPEGSHVFASFSRLIRPKMRDVDTLPKRFIPIKGRRFDVV